jgi:hypothetical protein
VPLALRPSPFARKGGDGADERVVALASIPVLQKELAHLHRHEIEDLLILATGTRSATPPVS